MIQEMTQQFGVEVRGGSASATEWQLVETANSLEIAQTIRIDSLDSHREARIVMRYVTPWRVVGEETQGGS